jgi:hypothetical protein
MWPQSCLEKQSPRFFFLTIYRFWTRSPIIKSSLSCSQCGDVSKHWNSASISNPELNKKMKQQDVGLTVNLRLGLYLGWECLFASHMVYGPSLQSSVQALGCQQGPKAASWLSLGTFLTQGGQPLQVPQTKAQNRPREQAREELWLNSLAKILDTFLQRCLGLALWPSWWLQWSQVGLCHQVVGCLFIE